MPRRTWMVGVMVSVSAIAGACGGSTTSSAPSDAGATSSSTSSSGSSGDASSSSGGSSGSSGGTPGGKMAFVVDHIFLGETDRAGVKNKDAWKAYGRNVDGLVTTVTSPTSPDLAMVCKRQAGAPATVHSDGDAGNDNAWGKEILKLMDPFSPTPSKSVDDRTAVGGRTPMIALVGTSGSWLYADTIAIAPTFSPTEEREIADAWMVSGTPRATFKAGGTDASGFYDSGVIDGEMLVELGFDVRITLHAGRIRMKIAPDAMSVTEGTVSGAVDTEELVAAMAEMAGRVSPELCSGTTLDAIKDSIRQASDIMKDGTQDPTKTCDGISVGLGFTAKRVVVGAVAPPEQPTPNPCQ